MASAAWAAWTSSHRILVSPSRVIAPRRLTPPDSRRLGLSPRQAPTSRLFVNRSARSTQATKERLTNGPTPGNFLQPFEQLVRLGVLDQLALHGLDPICQLAD